MSYFNCTHLSKSDPGKVLHLVCDCLDSYYLFNIVPITKKSANLEKLTVNAVGTINHSSLERDYMFFLDEYKKNPNLILTCFYLHILKHFQYSASHPPILWLQSDNCFKENKNQWMLAFSTWLVHLGWFQEVMIFMLPSGHTHIDINQMFSTFSIYLNSHSVEFVTDLAEALKAAYKKEQTKLNGFFYPQFTTL